jgi:2-methylfumaryl-CoA hydratase
VDKAELPGRNDLGALRLRTYATKNLPCAEFPTTGEQVVLDLDYWALLPR